MARPKKNSKVVTCAICKKKKRLHKSRVTCSPRCALKYRNLNRNQRKLK